MDPRTKPSPLFATDEVSWIGLSAGPLAWFAAHALNPFLAERGTLHTWETAVHYQLFHALALLAVSGYSRAGEAPLRRLRAVIWLWIVGTFCFSGSLYLLAAGASPHLLGPVTPLGGVCLILGWVWLCFAAADVSHS